MKTIMKVEDLRTTDQLADFLSAIQTVVLLVISDKGAYTTGSRENWSNSGDNLVALWIWTARTTSRATISVAYALTTVVYRSTS
jgi:hypothetical protein